MDHLSYPLKSAGVGIGLQHSLIMWSTVSSLSPHDLHLLFFLLYTLMSKISDVTSGDSSAGSFILPSGRKSSVVIKFSRRTHNHRGYTSSWYTTHAIWHFRRVLFNFRHRCTSCLLYTYLTQPVKETFFLSLFNILNIIKLYFHIISPYGIIIIIIIII